MIGNWLTVPDAAKLIACTPGRVHQLVCEKRLKVIRFNQKALGIDKDSAEAYANSERKVGRPRKNKAVKRRA